MKTQLKSQVKNAAIIVISVLLLTANVMAEKKPGSDSGVQSKYDKIATANLITGIHSENNGLKKSCIYFAGKYKVKSCVDALCKELKSNNDPAIKILASLSLYSIGDKKGIEAVKKASRNATDLRVRKMCSEIYNSYITNEPDLYLSDR